MFRLVKNETFLCSNSNRSRNKEMDSILLLPLPSRFGVKKKIRTFVAKRI